MHETRLFCNIGYFNFILVNTDSLYNVRYDSLFVIFIFKYYLCPH